MRATFAAAALPIAQAIMIPSTNSFPELSALGNAHTVTDPRSQIIKVDCPGCQFASNEHGKLTWTHAIENSLVLNISVGSSPETLELNGVRFYPPVMSLTSENPVPYIPQVPADMSMVEIKKKAEKLAKHALRLTNWAFQAGTSQTVSETGEELLTIHLQLNALERQEINVPDIAITTLKNSNGELAILKIETKDKKQVAKEECKDWPLLCKWRSILADKLGFMGGFSLPSLPGPFGMHGKPPCSKGHGKGRGKHGWKGPHGHFEQDDEMDMDVERPHHRFPPHKGEHPHHGPEFDGEYPPPYDGRHGEGRPWKHNGHNGPRPDGEEDEHHGRHGWHHHHGHHHGHHARWHRALHIFGRIMLTVFVPILLGVAAGMVTYLLGMMIGAVIAAVYMKIRGRKAKYQAIALDEEEDDDETPRSSMEKLAYKDDDEEPLPVYAEKEVC